MADAAQQELLDLTRKLLDSIAKADWAAYEKLCDPTLTCFEAEARGQLVEGMAFHQFYFDLGAANGPRTTTLASPHVRFLGADVAVVSYVRLTQRLDASGAPVTVPCEETRIWQRQGTAWKHVHFHRSNPS